MARYIWLKCQTNLANLIHIDEQYKIRNKRHMIVKVLSDSHKLLKNNLLEALTMLLFIRSIFT